MTHHVECVARFVPASEDRRARRASRVGTARHRLDGTDPVWLDILTSR